MHLQSEHLTLRPATADDLDDLYRIYGDPATNTFNPAGPHADIAYSRQVLAGWLEHIESYGYGNWAIACGQTRSESLVLVVYALSIIPTLR